MKAFVDTEVTKEQLLANLERHAREDRFRSGFYWTADEFERGDDPAFAGEWKACAVGCTLIDYRPEMVKDETISHMRLHSEYEVLFGIPADLAALEDLIFENLGFDDPDRLKEWPLQFVRAIKVGADLEKVADLCGTDLNVSSGDLADRLLELIEAAPVEES